MARCGRSAFTRAVAATTLSTAACRALPLVENESIATRGSSINRLFALSAAAIAISASSSASGSTTSAQSEKIRPPLIVWNGSHSIIRKKLDTSLNDGPHADDLDRGAHDIGGGIDGAGHRAVGVAEADHQVGEA